MQADTHMHTPLTHMQADTQAHSNSHVCTHAWMYKCMLTCMHTPTKAHLYIYTHVHTCSYTMHSRMYTHAHTMHAATPCSESFLSLLPFLSPPTNPVTSSTTFVPMTSPLHPNKCRVTQGEGAQVKTGQGFVFMLLPLLLYV
jgi:hypothetical protein